MMDDLKAFTAQFLKNRDSLFAFICMFTHRPDVAEDIFQEVWLKLAEAAEKDTQIGDVAAWSRGVAKNLILQHWRSQKTNRVVADSRVLESMDKAFELDQAASLRPARAAALKLCIDSLPEKSKTFLRLKFEKGLTAVEIAASMQESYEAIRKSLSRLRQSLEDCARKRLAAGGHRL
jgi:RNA polymerase sigma-70 factor (ECF subfamily)